MRLRFSRFFAVTTVGIVVLAGLLVAGCGSSGGGSSAGAEEAASSSPSGSTGGAEPSGSESASSEATVGKGLPLNTEGAISSLPKEVQAYYKGEPGNVGPSVLSTFKSEAKPPYTIGYASTYAGNSWRAAGLEYLEDVVVPKYEKLGLVKELRVTQSEGDIPTQIQNEKQLLDQGANGLMTCCPAPGLEKSVEYSHGKNVPFVAFTGGVNSQFSLSTTVNYYLAGYQEAQSLAEELGGQGSVVLVSGIQGAESSDGFDKGAEKALAAFPGINFEGVIAGEWTDSIAKAEMLKFLGTHPQPLDGVVAQAATETGVLQALLQSGREVPRITVGGEIGPMCYWKNHPDWIEKGFQMWPPRAEIELGFRSLLKTMLGQGPKIETIARPQANLTLDEVKKLLPENCSESDTGWLPLYGEEWLPEEQLEGFFEKPFPLSEWEKHVG